MTFNTSADLRWKLQKADILSAVSVIPRQRPGGGGLQFHKEEGGRGKGKRNLRGGLIGGDFIKQEVGSLRRRMSSLKMRSLVLRMKR